MSNLRKQLVVGATIALVLLVGSAAYFFTRAPSCRLIATDPLAKGSKQTASLLTSSDKSALVSFLGSFKYEIEKKATKEVYMPLIAKKVTEKKSADDKTTSEVQIVADCATLTFAITTTKDSSQVSSIAVKLVKENKDITTCTVAPTGIIYKSDCYYSCQNFPAYECRGKSSDGKEVLIATLNIADLKLETDRPSSAEKDKFSKAEDHCKYGAT